MSQATPALSAPALPGSALAPAVPTISFAQLAPWLLFAGLLAQLVVFFVSTAQGAVAFPGGTVLHELVHDGRHLLGYPCH